MARTAAPTSFPKQHEVSTVLQVHPNTKPQVTALPNDYLRRSEASAPGRRPGSLSKWQTEQDDRCIWMAQAQLIALVEAVSTDTARCRTSRSARTARCPERTGHRPPPNQTYFGVKGAAPAGQPRGHHGRVSRYPMNKAFTVVQRRSSTPAPCRLGRAHTGLLLTPETVEFWLGRHGRLHRRVHYSLARGEWTHWSLQP